MKAWVFLLFPVSLLALPQDAAPQAGEVRIEESASSLKVHASNQSIIHWKSFSIDQGEKVQFVQPGKQAAVLNRVIGGDKSVINGLLEASGRVYLLNRNGVMIGKSGVINAASFTASALDTLDEKFLKGGELRFQDKEAGGVINLGRVEALQGDVILLGKTVVNEGDLIGKYVGLAAGQDVIIKPEGNERIFIVPEFHPSRSDVGVESAGTIEAAMAEIKTDGNAYRLAIRHSGTIEATKIKEEGGRILLVADRGVNESSGKMVAHGGAVHLLGKKVGLTEGATIDVSGEKPGEVLLGGDFQGKGNTIKSRLTFLEKGTNILAGSTHASQGGKVVAWSDGGTLFYGEIDASGGPNGGNGGFVEISGVEHLTFSGKVSTLAPKGEVGTLLLDPTDVTISSAATSGATFQSGSYTYSASTANIDSAELITNLGSTNVTVSTTSGFTGNGDMTVSDGISWLSNNNLTLIADRNFSCSGDILSLMGGAVSISAGGSFTLTGAITSNTNTISVSSGGDMLLQNGGIGSMSPVSVTAGGNLSLIGETLPALIGSVGGSVSLYVGGNVLLQGGSAANTYAQIGENQQNITSDLLFKKIGGNLQLLAGSGSGSYAQIGHVATDPNSTAGGDILIESVGGSVLLQGRGTNAYAQIGHSGIGNSHTLSGDIVVDGVLGSIQVFAGTGERSAAIIGHGNPINSANGTMSGSVTVKQRALTANNPVFHVRSNDALLAYSTIGFGVLPGGSQIIRSDHVTISTNAPITVEATPGISYANIGYFDAGPLTGTADVLIGTVSVGTERSLTVLPSEGSAGNFTGSAVIGGFVRGASTIQTNVSVKAGDIFLNGNTGTNMGFAYIVSRNPGAVGPGNVNILADNLFVGINGTIANSAEIYASNNMTILANQDMHIFPFARVDNGGSFMDLVVDNQFPDPPEFGSGRFILDANATLTSSGTLRIYSVTNQINTINSPVNGVNFVSGTPFVDSTTERWGLYYPQSFGGIPFTFFYKERILPFRNLYRRAVSEMFQDIRVYDDFLFSPKCFLFGYDTLCYDALLKAHDEMSSFDLFGDESYEILEPHYRNYHTKAL